MDNARNTSSRFRGRLDSLISPSKWEAPDRKFIGHRDIITRSLARYNFVAHELHGVLLEVGCGRGYGLEFLESQLNGLIGLDISINHLKEARKISPKTGFINANGEKLPFPDSTFDSIIAFEVIEHMDKDLDFLISLKRILKSDGVVALSTPNKKAASGNSMFPLDRFHVREYSFVEFRDLLKSVFSNVKVYSQYDKTEASVFSNKMINQLPVRWKYILPVSVQSALSVLFRPPLLMSDCHFIPDAKEPSQTFIAICRL